MMKLEVLLFASLKDAVGFPVLNVELNGSGTVKDLLAMLFREWPQLEGASAHLLVSVNQEYASPDQQLDPNDEIALFPPVSGG